MTHWQLSMVLKCWVWHQPQQRQFKQNTIIVNKCVNDTLSLVNFSSVTSKHLAAQTWELHGMPSVTMRFFTLMESRKWAYTPTPMALNWLQLPLSNPYLSVDTKKYGLLQSMGFGRAHLKAIFLGHITQYYVLNNYILSKYNNYKVK